MNISKIVLLLLIISNFSFAQQKKITYCSNQTSSGFLQVFIMNEDGSDKKQVTDTQENCMRPKWSPDGKQIVFYTSRGQIYLIRNIDTTYPIEPSYMWSGQYPHFMPDGNQIMFNDEYEGVLSIVLMDTNGTDVSLLSDGGYSNMQVLSHNGDKLIFSSFSGGSKAIMMADMNDTTDNYISKVSKNSDANLEPDISPDDKKIVYSSFDNNLRGTIRLNEDGEETALTKGMSSANVPRFSPDGSKIAFVVIGERSVSLYVMDSDGSNIKDLNVRGGNVGTFEWMDNERIIYDAGPESETSIGIINVNSGDNEIIADGGFNLHPSVKK